LVVGGLSGAAGAGAGMLTQGLQVYGAIPGALIEGGIQGVAGGLAGGFGNVIMEDDWDAFGSGFEQGFVTGFILGGISGGIKGCLLADANSKNLWWGNEIKEGRTKWSFFTSELPYETIEFPVKSFDSMRLNDCIPITLLEDDNSFGGNLTYDQAVIDSKYIEGHGVDLTKEKYRELLSGKFKVSNFDPGVLANTDWSKQNLSDKGLLINANWKHNLIRHSDVLRSIEYYHSKGTILQFRIGSYNLKSIDENWWFFILRGLK